MRVVLEYGSILASDGKRTKATMFVAATLASCDLSLAINVRGCYLGLL